MPITLALNRTCAPHLPLADFIAGPSGGGDVS
jgi:hypothetical protein